MIRPELDAILNPPDQQDEFTHWLRDEAGYLAAKRLPDGSYATITRLLTTLGICLGVGQIGWARRFCYRDTAECLAAWQALESQGDTPTGWIARRPEEPEARPAIRGYAASVVYRDDLGYLDGISDEEIDHALG